MANASGLVIGGTKVPFVAEEALNKGDSVQLGTLSTNAQFVKKSTAGDRGIGFVDENYDANDHCDVQIDGTCYARAADASISAGARLKAAADGEVTTADTDKDEVVGQALAASAAENDFIPVLIQNFTLSA